MRRSCPLLRLRRVDVALWPAGQRRAPGSGSMQTNTSVRGQRRRGAQVEGKVGTLSNAIGI